MSADTKQQSLFLAVGHNGSRLTSADGTKWKNLKLGKEGEVYRAVCFGNGRFVTVGSYGGSNIFAASKNGLAWETGTRDAHYSQYFRGLGYCKDAFLALGGDPGSVGDSKPFLSTSTDGVQWTDHRPILGKHILRRIAFGNDLYVTVGDRGRRTVSKDAVTWTDAPDVKAIDTLVDIAFGNGLFVGVGLHGLRMSSKDGLKWSKRIVGEEGEHLNSIIWAEDRFVAVGMGATYTSRDGLEWERAKNKDAPLCVAYGKGIYVGANWKGRLLRSKDAVTWEQVHKCEHHIEAVAFGEG